MSESSQNDLSVQPRRRLAFAPPDAFCCCAVLPVRHEQVVSLASANHRRGRLGPGRASRLQLPGSRCASFASRHQRHFSSARQKQAWTPSRGSGGCSIRGPSSRVHDHSLGQPLQVRRCGICKWPTMARFGEERNHRRSLPYLLHVARRAQLLRLS